METITINHVISIINVMIKTVMDNESYFCELDSKAGDGDFGTSLAKGFKSLKENWEDMNKENIGKFMKSCSMMITEECGGASGPLWGGAFLAAGRYAKGKEEINIKELSELGQSMVDGVQKRGGAKLGDKTLLDAFIPAVESLKMSASRNEDMLSAVKKSVAAASKGTESTKKIVALKGRASYVGERSLGFPDAGAVAIAVILQDILDKAF